MPYYQFILSDDPSPVIVGGSQNTNNSNTNSETGQAVSSDSSSTAADPLGSFNSIAMILVWVAVIGVMYFITIRPQRKKDKQLKELQSSIKPGDNVLTSSGFYGKVMDVGDDCFVVEFGTNRGIRIPVRKSDVLGIQSPNMTITNKEKE